MPSAFRSTKTPLAARGTKAWTAGTTLASTGLSELDALLGGGQAVGSSAAVQTDRIVDFPVVEYWCAEAVSQQQQILVCTQQDTEHLIDTLVDSLPRNLSLSKEPEPQPAALESLAEDEDLQIAWQYRASVQKQRLGNISQTKKSFRHSYDLQRKLLEQIPNARDFFVPANLDWSQEPLAVLRDMMRLIRAHGPPDQNEVLRILLYHPNMESLTPILPFLVTFCRNLPVVVLLLVTRHDTQTLRCCDASLTLESFVARRDYPPPPEFRLLDGLLHLHKVTHVYRHYGDTTVSKRPAAWTWGIKRDARKLRIELLHIPPEEYGAGSGSGGVRSTTGCGSAALDF